MINFTNTVLVPFGSRSKKPAEVELAIHGQPHRLPWNPHVDPTNTRFLLVLQLALISSDMKSLRCILLHNRRVPNSTPHAIRSRSLAAVPAVDQAARLRSLVHTRRRIREFYMICIKRRLILFLAQRFLLARWLSIWSW